MIGRLSGTVVEQDPDGSCVLDVNGVGYEVFVPLGGLGRLPGPPETTTLHVHTHVREDALTLYGFVSRADREAFRVVLGVSGVGPKIALAVVSALPARELSEAVLRADPKVFKGIPGVGKKTAERLLLELKDKLARIGGAASGAAPAPSAPRVSGPLATVAGALVQMGYKPAQAETAVASLGDADGRDVGELLREALGHLS